MFVNKSSYFTGGSFRLFYLTHKVYFISLLGYVISGYIDKFAKTVSIFFLRIKNHKTDFIAFFA